MKKFKFMKWLLAAMLFVPMLAACDKDDNDDPAFTDAIKGSYTGSLDYSVVGYDPGTIPGDYDLIIANGKETDEVAVSLPECTFTPPGSQRALTIPSITIDDVEVKVKNNVYTVDEDDYSISIDGVVYSGKILGTITGKNIVLDYVVRPGRMPMDINFKFKGVLK